MNPVQHRLLLVLFFLLGTIAISNAQQHEGSYVGKIKELKLRGKTYPVSAASFRLRNDSLYCRLPKIGKMPGQIILHFPVHIDSLSGQITSKAKIFGRLYLPVSSLRLKADDFSEGQLSPGGIMRFKLSLHSQLLGIFNFPVSFYFEGKKEE